MTQCLVIYFVNISSQSRFFNSQGLLSEIILGADPFTRSLCSSVALEALRPQLGFRYAALVGSTDETLDTITFRVFKALTWTFLGLIYKEFIFCY